MRIRLTRGMAAGVLSVAALLLFVRAPYASASQGFGVSPTSQEVSVAPGGTVKGTVTILNDGDTDVTYKLYAADYKVEGEDYKGNFDNSGEGPKLSPMTWFGLPAGTFVVKARDQVKQPYSLTVPLEAAIGGHYGAVFAETIPKATKGSALVQRTDRLASIFYIAVGGNLKKSGEVLPLEVSWLQALSPVTGILRVHNSGNVHFAAEPTAQLASPFGKVGKPQRLKGEVLPGTTRKFDISLPSTSPIGIYKVSVETKFLDQTVKRSQWMILIPRLTFLILSGTLLLLLVLGFWLLIRRARRR